MATNVRAFARARSARTTSDAWLRTSMVLCVVLALCAHARAQEPTASQALATLRAAVQHAEFERATAEARRLLARADLCAHERNDTLELLAVTQIAARDEAGARDTLQELFTRDPDHTPKLRDPGPQVEAAFARAEFAQRPSANVPVVSQALRDAHGRTRIEVSLGVGHDAVESVDVFASADGEPTQHVVAEVGTREKVAVTLPAVDPRLLAQAAPKLSLYVEARAPSGYVLGRDGTREAPLKVQLEPHANGQLGKRWWVWTSAAIIVAGVAIGGAIAAH